MEPPENIMEILKAHGITVIKHITEIKHTVRCPHNKDVKQYPMVTVCDCCNAVWVCIYKKEEMG